ncbi:MAG: SOS response-associated peptidase family protein [Sphingobium sp.]
MGTANRPAQGRIAALALETLEDALAQAQHGPVQREQGHRLALAWLCANGVALNWQCTDFWMAMADPMLWVPAANYAHGQRTQRMRAMLDNCYYRLGLELPSWESRYRLAARYHPDLDESGEGAQRLLMCNRYQPGERTRIEKLFNVQPLRAFNDGPATVHPKDPGWVLRMVDGTLVLDQMTWGYPLIRRGKKEQLLKPKAVNNTRFDKLGGFWARWTAPANRCLIPTARFAEAVGTTGAMKETWLSVIDQPIVAWAGLWGKSEEWGDWYSGVMTDAAPELAAIHDRSPVILLPDQCSEWLTAPVEDLAKFDRPFPAAHVHVEKTDTLWAGGKNAGSKI